MQPAILIVILCAICVCALLAHRLRLAPPVSFLLGGLALALIPGITVPHIEPETMLLLFLPPILMEAAFFTSIREFRANLRPILLLAIGLVVLTAGVTAAVVVAMLPTAGWALGFVLGAIISPPDAAAATSALRGAPIPRRVISILEGESLVNDATGIVLYKFAVAAVVIGGFSLGDATVEFAWKAGAGIIVGLGLAYIYLRIFPFFREQSVEILSTFVPPYAAYLLAESMHASGVLAVVSAGLLIGWHAPSLFSHRMRLPTEAIWKMMVFFINALAFLLIGLQLPGLVTRLGIYDASFVVLCAFAVCAAAIAVRFLYVFGTTYLLRSFFSGYCHREPLPSWQNIFLISWTGMRGVVTLALAAALPFTLQSGEPFPERDLIIFLAVSVILATLVLQGVTLPWITRTLSLTFDPKRMQEEWLARVNTTRRALATLDKLEKQEGIHLPALQRIRSHYQERLESLGDGPNTPLDGSIAPSLTSHPLVQAENRIWQEVLRTERETLLNMRREFTIDDNVMHDMLREMDLRANSFQYELDDPFTRGVIKSRSWRISRRTAA
jgi:CPA1 family monovalent cation:H+ antiporter